MHPSTEPAPDRIPTHAECEFAAKVLRDLLHRIEVRNVNAAADPRSGRRTFLVSHAWTDDSSIRLIYTTPPSDRIWGLARDTRESLIGAGPWNEADDPALYYYLLDLEEEWPGGESREPGGCDDLICWRGYPITDLPTNLSELPEDYRYTSPPPDPTWIDRTHPPVIEPRRYADPSGPLAPGVPPPLL